MLELRISHVQWHVPAELPTVSLQLSWALPHGAQQVCSMSVLCRVKCTAGRALL